ncbi:MAG: DUF2934 domain-containing protein [Chitinivibrionales bacterium]|nr:DUF2934 domain-containing protein [Chitinivibrionales bacterium]MBD3356874.1 DUF2934 domain-containing protein [Chitinivibrionales bacterium]
MTLKEMIEKRAFELFVERGGQHGYHMQDWLKAESEILPSQAGAPSEEHQAAEKPAAKKTTKKKAAKKTAKKAGKKAGKKKTAKKKAAGKKAS